MWFPNNKPVVREPKQLNTTPHVVTTKFPTREPPSGARVRSKGYGGHSVGETPGPIPNPEAKTHSADGTAPGRVWESRSPPEQLLMVEAPTTRLGPPTFNPKNRRTLRGQSLSWQHGAAAHPRPCAFQCRGP